MAICPCVLSSDTLLSPSDPQSFSCSSLDRLLKLTWPRSTTNMVLVAGDPQTQMDQIIHHCLGIEKEAFFHAPERVGFAASSLGTTLSNFYRRHTINESKPRWMSSQPNALAKHLAFKRR